MEPELLCRICSKPFKQEDKKDLKHEGTVSIKLDGSEVLRQWRYKPEDRLDNCKECCEMGNKVAAFTAKMTYKELDRKIYYNKFKKKR